MIVLSPHLDDAVLSLAEWMLTCGVPVTVATVFSEGDLARKREDSRALALLGALQVHLGLSDVADRSGVPAGLMSALRRVSLGGQVLVPLGVHHPDHALVSCHAVVMFPGRIAGFYEELPYRVMFPDERAARVAELSDTFKLEPSTWGGHLAEKRAAVACYASQAGEDIERCAFAPERIWWVR